MCKQEEEQRPLGSPPLVCQAWPAGLLMTFYGYISHDKAGLAAHPLSGLTQSLGGKELMALGHPASVLLLNQVTG